MVESFKEIAEYIQTHLEGCKFVGISTINEVFVELDYDDPEMQNGAALRIKRQFPYISRVTVVVRPSTEEVQKMVNDLNIFLGDSPRKKNLLDIREF